MVRKTVKKQSKSVKRVGKQATPKTIQGETFYGYDFVLITDMDTGRSRQLGGPVHQPATIFQKDPVHRLAWEETLKRGMYHYEWLFTRGKTRKVYQTSCVSLPLPDSQTAGILSFSRDISRPVSYGNISLELQEPVAPRTFAQLLLATRETEKKGISKALHDEVGSSAVMLTALLSLVRASVKTGNSKQALRDLEQLDQQLKGSIERLKNVIVSLRPPSLENKGGLEGAIRDLLENVSSLSHIPYTFDYDEEGDHFGLSDDVKILLYRIVQEALTNTVKHAHAKHIRVQLKRVKNDINLLVCDDGMGFDPDQQLSIEHIGLLAMKDSVELLGGSIAVKSAPGKGTQITVVCPCVVYGGN